MESPNIGDNKTYLKISQDLNKMSPQPIELPSGRLNEKFSDEKDAVIEVLKTINAGEAPWNYCFKGNKNTPYEDRYFFIENKKTETNKYFGL